MALIGFGFGIISICVGGRAADRESENLVQKQGDSLWVNPGQFKAHKILEFISDYLKLPLILTDRALDPFNDTITIKDKIKINNAEGMVEAMQKLGIRIEKVSFNGRIILGAGRLDANFNNQKTVKPQETEKRNLKINLTHGLIPATELVQFISDFDGQDVVYEGRFNDRLASLQVKIPVDINEVNSDLCRFILEFQGLKFLHIMNASGQEQWRLSVIENSSRVLRPPVR